MSPELLDTDLQGSRRTKYSDRYALGMVIYEVLSGHIPFYQHGNWSIPLKVAKGDRPEKPQGAEGLWFADGVWEVLECCWTTQPKDRPSVEDILRYLNQASKSWTRPSLPQVAVPPATNSPTTNPFDITDEGDMWVDEDEVPSPSDSLDDHDLPSKGNTDDNGIYPSDYQLGHSFSKLPQWGRKPPSEGGGGDTPVNILARGRSNTKKALLVGIGRRDGIGRAGRKSGSISTQIPDVRAFEAFLKGGCLLSPSISFLIQ